MQIVINIPEGIYKKLCKNSSTDIVRQAVIEGTPLPKGHGRLIDADDLKRIGRYAHTNTDMDNAPTIIEADRAESEDNE